MTEQRRRSRLRLLLPRRGGDPRASLVAFLVQATIIAIIVPSLIVPIAFDLLRDDSGRIARPERISYVVAVPDRERTLEAPVAGGDGREPGGVETTVISEPIIAPSEVPTGVPAAPADDAPAVDPLGVGPLVGGGGPTRGVRPSFTDARLWAPTAEELMAPGPPLTRADTLRLMLAERANVYLDSMARVQPGRDPADWTFDHNGRTYGIDSKFIRLGKFSIPTALLAALPLNQQANPIASERIQRLNSMRGEIQYQAARMAREDEFRDAVRELRERKERERMAEAAKKAGERRPDDRD